MAFDVSRCAEMSNVRACCLAEAAGCGVVSRLGGGGRPGGQGRTAGRPIAGWARRELAAAGCCACRGGARKMRRPMTRPARDRGAPALDDASSSDENTGCNPHCRVRLRGLRIRRRWRIERRNRPHRDVRHDRSGRDDPQLTACYQSRRARPGASAAPGRRAHRPETAAAASCRSATYNRLLSRHASRTGASRNARHAPRAA